MVLIQYSFISDHQNISKTIFDLLFLSSFLNQPTFYSIHDFKNDLDYSNMIIILINFDLKYLFHYSFSLFMFESIPIKSIFHYLSVSLCFVFHHPSLSSYFISHNPFLF